MNKFLRMKGRVIVLTSHQIEVNEMNEWKQMLKFVNECAVICEAKERTVLI